MSSNASTYSPEIQKKIVEILAKILTKANEDEAFGELCLQDFGAAFEQLIGSPMPEGAPFSCVRQGGRVVIKLPEYQGVELTEFALDSVAGGGGLDLQDSAAYINAWNKDIAALDKARKERDDMALKLLEAAALVR